MNRSAGLLTNVREPDQIMAKVATPRAIPQVLPTPTENQDFMLPGAKRAGIEILRTAAGIAAGNVYAVLPSSAGRSNFPPA